MNESLFNTEVLNEYYGGTESPGAIEIFCECSTRMLDTLDSRLTKLNAAIESSDFQQVIYYSHQLKGSFNATGSPLLARICDELEKDAKLNDKAKCADGMQQLDILSKKFVNELQSFIAKISKH